MNQLRSDRLIFLSLHSVEHLWTGLNANCLSVGDDFFNGHPQSFAVRVPTLVRGDDTPENLSCTWNRLSWPLRAGGAVKHSALCDLAIGPSYFVSGAGAVCGVIAGYPKQNRGTNRGTFLNMTGGESFKNNML